MATFLFDINPIQERIFSSMFLALMLKENGHIVYYTDTSDSVFTIDLLKEGISRICYETDMEWFTPDLVLLDREISVKSEYYTSCHIQYIYLEWILPSITPIPVPTGISSDNIPVLSFYTRPLRQNRWKSELPLITREKLLISRLYYFHSFTHLTVLLCKLDIAGEERTGRKNKLLYKTLKALCEYYPGYQVVLAVKKEEQMDDLFPLPSNMHLFRNIDEETILPYCNVMITAGNLQDLTECIYAEVPVLVYPVSLRNRYLKSEQWAKNYHLGLKSNLHYLTPGAIHRQVNTILMKEKQIKKHLSCMRVAMDKQLQKNTEIMNWLVSICG